MKTAWHYTYGPNFAKIKADHFIRPTAIGLRPGEKAITWFSLNPFWEETVMKLWHPADGSPERMLRMDGLHRQFGIYRIGVDAGTLYSWDDLRKLSGMPAEIARGLQTVARHDGAKPKEWMGTFESVTEAQWMAVEKFDGFKWGKK